MLPNKANPKAIWSTAIIITLFFLNKIKINMKKLDNCFGKLYHKIVLTSLFGGSQIIHNNFFN